VEGEVRRVGDRVRVNAQLIDADTDEHLWAEQYDRELSDIFAIQSDVARQIATALRATLTSDEKRRLEQRPTASSAQPVRQAGGGVCLSLKNITYC
jgi:adenylate cyclase